jgi:SAM-dependent methyltransferase
MVSETLDRSDPIRCVRCGAAVSSGDAEWGTDSSEADLAGGVLPALECHGCGALYPVWEGVPVMFEDEERTRAVLSGSFGSDRVGQVERKMSQAARLASDALAGLKEGDERLDALGWEIYFWEQWKAEDLGVVNYDRRKIDAFLECDTEGGGRLDFLRRVSEEAGGLSGKVALNIGAGRDLLLERFLDAGCRVVEVDVVLEPLALLRRRGAHLCVCCDARKLPFDDGAFDVATSFGTLHHIWPIEEPLRELLRVTRGSVHVNEPNSYALTRWALRLPAGVRNRLKRWYSEGQSRSPYESCISPRAFRRSVSRASGRVVELSFPRSSWVSRGSGGIRGLVRAANLLLLDVLPFASSHFDAVVRRTTG